jgi:two-component system C4-dicarboxylate transport sensor histidine kinase DctB
MRDASSPRRRELRLVAYVALGVVAGLTYVVFDMLAEAKLRLGTLTGPLAHAHEVIDHVSPVLVGALLGVCAHYLRLRAQLSAAEEAAGRADALRVRLQKVERDQAIWVLAAAILHEVNNPLHALGLLLDELPACPQGDEARRDDLIARARAQADRALSQLRLLRSVGGAGEPELQKIALDRVVSALADDVGSLAREEGLSVKLECERPVRASADPAYVRTILENLLDNSLHSLRGRGGSITIHLGVEEGRAVVRVRDDGPPLDPGVRATLFEPLRTTKAQGLGLGLPIARALARAMRGDLALDDAEPGTKSFRLELPLGDGP